MADDASAKKIISKKTHSSKLEGRRKAVGIVSPIKKTAPKKKVVEKEKEKEKEEEEEEEEEEEGEEEGGEGVKNESLAIVPAEDGLKKKIKHKSGYRSLQMIRKYQNEARNVTQKAPLVKYIRHLSREIAKKMANDNDDKEIKPVQLASDAMDMLIDAYEVNALRLFRAAKVFINFNDTRTITCRELVIVQVVKNEMSSV
jgi:hypothetical protein